VIGWYLWFELEDVADLRKATAAGLIMASAVHGAKLVHVQSRVSHGIAEEELSAAKRSHGNDDDER
jgi:hypothetical protein